MGHYLYPVNIWIEMAIHKFHYLNDIIHYLFPVYYSIIIAMHLLHNLNDNKL